MKVVTILHSTIADNDASNSGGGLRIAAGNVLLHNTLIADNSATTSNPDGYGVLLAASSYNLDAGSDRLAVSNLPRSSAVAYDRLGRKAAVTPTDPDGIGGGPAPTAAGGFSLPPDV